MKRKVVLFVHLINLFIQEKMNSPRLDFQSLNSAMKLKSLSEH